MNWLQPVPNTNDSWQTSYFPA